MKIGFDGKRAVNNNTGLGNYSRLLVEVLADRYPDNEYTLYAPRIRSNPRLEPLLSRPKITLTPPATQLGKMLPALWRTYGMTHQMRHEGVDLIHGLSNELPLNVGKAGVPSVVTIHDLIFLHHPECYKPADRAIYDYKFRRAAQQATRVIAISECTKRDLMVQYDIPEEKIDVVYQGCAKQFHRTPDTAEIERVKAKYGIQRPYIISVGTIERRKNQMMPVRCMRALPAEFELVLVGRRTEYARELDQYIATYQLGDRVKFIENVPFTDLPALYAGAYVSSYTSRYEGFGIPVIESLSVGTPVIVAKGSCLEEAGGFYTPAVNPDEMDEFYNTVKEIINYPALREKLVTQGRRHIAQFTDRAMAEGTMATYRKALAAYGH